jgi:hypothetical protein
MNIIPNFKRDAGILAAVLMALLLFGCADGHAQDQLDKGVYLGQVRGRDLYRYDDTTRGDRCYIIHSLNNTSISCVHP